MQVRIGRRFRIAVNKSTIKVVFSKFLGLHFYGLISMNPSVNTLGILNRLSDNRFVLFMDYDSVLFSVVRAELMQLQNKFDIGSAVILTTGGVAYDDSGREYSSYHVVALGKMKYWDIIKCLDDTSVDVNFKRVPFFFNQRAWCLRIFGKYSDRWKQLRDRPQLREVVWAKTRRECSLAMYEFLQKWYDVGEFPCGFEPKFDNLHSVRILKYQTTNSTWGSELCRVVGIDRIKKLGDKD